MNLSSVVAALPIDAIEQALNDPRNLGKEAAVAESLISSFVPGLAGPVLAALVALFVAWVYASGGGTISADPDPEVDAQLSLGHRGPRG